MPRSPTRAPESAQLAPTRIVGIGASAGGLQPLELFFARVPERSGLAYVVVQHMDPTHKAMLGELLQRVTAMPVHEATQGEHIEPDVVYVIPPASELTVAHGQLHLRPVVQPRGLRLPINTLFESLAADQGANAIGVVLSGMGFDGTLGLRAIKSKGGLTLAQQPDSAQFDSMPASAIAAGCVDIIAPAAELPTVLWHKIGEPAAPPLPLPLPAGPGLKTHEPQAGVGALEGILSQLQAHRKHDLSQYKPSTLMRRIERRVAVHGLKDMATYEAFLKQNPQELDLLFAEMLIGVTSFFRDPAMWTALHDTVLPDLLARHDPALSLRAWVVGCSTGEEAYSLAMVLQELIEAQPQHGALKVQIFATDLSAEAIAVARRGLYATRIASEMTPQRLARFFAPKEGRYQIDQRTRDMVLFAQHDVILDPPFTRLDFLSCRNLLIYFNAQLQHRLMPLFHYSLRPGGVLALGGSETVGRSRMLFTPLSAKARLYQRSDHPAHVGSVDFPVNRHSTRRVAQEAHLPTPPHHLANVQSLADQVLLQEFSPAAVLVNDVGDIIYISGRTGKYLEPAAGKANWNIHVMARPGIRTQLAVALRQAVLEKKSIELQGLQIEEDAQHPVNITVKALDEPAALQDMVMIVFREAPALAAVAGESPRPYGTIDPAVSQELARSREEIRALRQEMRASQEELQSANEELQSTNEELQSANEELTTSKEESQSMNEELQTINGELQCKLDDLSLAQSDMQNLLNSTDIATLFLDQAFHVRRFTEQACKVFHLRDGDVGRPLSDLATTLIYPELDADARTTLRTLAACEKQVATTDGHWYSVRIMPYRTLANLILGVVLTLVDITAAKELESQLRKA
jgi:two-component system CheB/CheR fusion protein